MTRYSIVIEVESMQLPMGSVNAAVKAIQEEKQCVVITSTVKEKQKGLFNF